MKKICIFLVVLMLICTVFFVGCDKEDEQELQYGKPYIYNNITFERDAGLKYSDINAITGQFTSASFKGEKPTNFEEFEAWLLENLDDYSIVKFEGENKVVYYYSVSIYSISFTETEATFVGEGTTTFEYSFVNGECVLSEESEKIVLRYKNGVVSLVRELTEGYRIVYNYKI